ncbi:class I adenylate-forming enzyme family protein [Actinomadura rupiterrae]|uniref:class I adenylate-forming enzyme family protein n=1 Tax=Actinomadura rupiterrae TaxID=559627 RepID=UPI0020A5F5A3|nr:class I adenylate-forming enzyme family protein [Actinomadura rupiterrae]MCP2340024.1 acyl-CoA synthetase (AMP-forming)/AMP-acid ligase II [Actinomadura rupiterrae]
MTLIRRLLDQAARTPSEVALIAGDGTELTYGDLRRKVLAVRNGLRAHGLQTGDGVLFSVRPSPDSLVLALGVVAAGGVVVFADPGAGPEMFAARLRLASPRWSAAESVLYAASRLRPVRALARRRGLLLPHLADLPLRHIYTGRRLPGVPAAALSLNALLATSSAGSSADASSAGASADASDVDVEVDVDPDAPAAVIFTSGTTQHPRAVVHTQASLVAALDLFRERIPLGPGDVVHTDQLMLGIPTLASGARWSMPPLFASPTRFALHLRERRATHTFCVPVHLSEILDVEPSLPKTLRYVLLGAAPAPAGVLRRAMEAAPHAEVLSVYAMTEILPVAIASASEKLAHAGQGDYLGVPLVRTRVAPDGELCLSGPNLCRGYLGEPPLQELPTGDLVRMEGDRLVLMGRKKDMLIRGKFNLYPGLYEPAISTLDGVDEAAIVGVPDPETGDEEVVLAITGTASPESLRRRLPQLIDHDALPDRIVVLPSLPRSGRTRKLDRTLLKEAVQ